MEEPREPAHTNVASLLKAAAVLFAILGLSFLVWVGAQWMEFPEARATQFGFQAPLWPALGIFLIVSVTAAVSLFWTAAKRVERGDSLFRRQPDGRNWSETSNGTKTDRET